MRSIITKSLRRSADFVEKFTYNDITKASTFVKQYCVYEYKWLSNVFIKQKDKDQKDKDQKDKDQKDKDQKDEMFENTRKWIRGVTAATFGIANIIFISSDEGEVSFPVALITTGCSIFTGYAVGMFNIVLFPTIAASAMFYNMNNMMNNVKKRAREHKIKAWQEQKIAEWKIAYLKYREDCIKYKSECMDETTFIERRKSSTNLWHTGGEYRY